MTMKKFALAFGVAVVAALALTAGAAEKARADCYVQAPLRPVHRTYIRRDVVEPGVYEVTRAPSLYGWVHHRVVAPDGSYGYVHRRVLLKPYRNYAHFQRPYVALSRERVTVYPEGYRWVRVKSRPDC
jgi:hypothetical protein